MQYYVWQIPYTQFFYFSSLIIIIVNRFYERFCTLELWNANLNEQNVFWYKRNFRPRIESWDWSSLLRAGRGLPRTGSVRSSAWILIIAVQWIEHDVLLLLRYLLQSFDSTAMNSLHMVLMPFPTAEERGTFSQNVGFLFKAALFPDIQFHSFT